MPQPARWPLPVHSPASHDDRRWALRTASFGDSGGAGALRHDDDLHATQSEMLAELRAWFTATLTAIREAGAVLGRLELPAPEGLVEFDMVDPTTICVLAGYGHIRNRAVTSGYVGLVTQEPFGYWRGLTGFYFASCPACDPDGEARFAEVQALLGEVAGSLGATEAGDAGEIEWRSAFDLHEALRPRRGWFEDRLAWGALLNPVNGLSPFWVINDDDDAATTDINVAAADVAADEAGATAVDGEVSAHDNCITGGFRAALVATGPVFLSRANLSYLDNFAGEFPRLLRRIGPGTTTVRFGEPEALKRLAGLANH